MPTEDKSGLGGGLAHGMQVNDPSYPPWLSGTPPTDITEPWMPGAAALRINA